MKKEEKLNHLKMLVNLAWVDGHISSAERTFIMRIAAFHQIADKVVEQLFVDAPVEVADPIKYSPEKRKEVMGSLLYLMRIDNDSYKPEIRYCISLAEKMGYTQAQIERMIDTN